MASDQVLDDTVNHSMAALEGAAVTVAEALQLRTDRLPQALQEVAVGIAKTDQGSPRSCASSL